MNKFVVILLMTATFFLGVAAAPMFSIGDNVIEMDADGICPKALAGKTCG